MKNKTNYATLTIEFDTYIDGSPCAQELYNAIADEYATTPAKLSAFRDRVSVRVVAFNVSTIDGKNARLCCWDGFLRYIFDNSIDVVFVWDGVTDFAAFDYLLHLDPLRKWERTTREEQTDKKAHKYNIVQGFKFAELSGDSGQRYSLNIWQQRADKRKRTVTRGFSLYAFDNITPCDSLAEFVESFTGERAENSGAFARAVVAFDSLYLSQVGAPFLGKKPLGFTCGTLARYAFFSSIYGAGEPRALDKKWKNEHKAVMGQGAWFRARNLFRGGVNCGAFDKWGVVLDSQAGRKINKYDVNSEYAFVASKMTDFGAWEVCELAEMFERKNNYIYIVVFDSLHMRRRAGMPPVFRNPWNGAESVINIEREFAMFADEVDELQHFYTFRDCSIKYLFRAERTKNGIFAPFVDKWYNLKAKAKNAQNKGLYVLSKMILNSALGQLGKRAKFPTVAHEWDNNTKRIELHIISPAEAEDDGAFSYSHGARVSALGRIHIMRKIRECCGNKNALNAFIYADTDSIEMYGEAPAGLVDPAKLGALKHEGEFCQAVFMQKKVYYNVSSFSPLSVDIHASGINARDIIDYLCDNYGVESASDLPHDAIANAFALGIRVKTRVSLNVKGGRALFPFWRKISTSPKRKQSFESMGGASILTDEKGTIREI